MYSCEGCHSPFPASRNDRVTELLFHVAGFRSVELIGYPEGRE